MKYSKLFTKTLKDAPADEVAKSAQLLIRAGYIHKEMAGVYVFMPLGLKVLDNIKDIIREEMDAIDGQEVQMTVLQPSDIFEKTDRWDDAKVDNWFKTKLVNGTELGMGLTHEEPIVDMLSSYVSSYKDLPIFVYQIQNKFRNELRAKSGILRGREFVMKDMYSFSRSQEEHEGLYERAAVAYHRIFERLGLSEITVRAKADGGIFTERYSDEFQTISEIGEDTLFCVPSTGECFNEEVTLALAPKIPEDEQPRTMEEVEGKGIIGVVELAKFLNIPVEKTTKTMLYQTDDGRIIAAAVRGGYDINEIKLRKVVGAKSLKLAEEDVVRRVTGAEVGYAGLLNLANDVEIFIDESCANRVNFEMGANHTNYHSINVNWGRDIKTPEQFYDIKMAREGDLHPETGEVYEVKRAVEVGNIFPLESKYTDALDVYFTNEKGERESIIAGCYGIGVSRVMGVIAEHFADESGLVWPDNIAPARVHLISLGADDEAEALYQKLHKSGIEVLYDDRDVRAGEKFADADLIGIPHRVVVSARTLAEGKLEYKARISEEAELIAEAELFAKLGIE